VPELVRVNLKKLKITPMKKLFKTVPFISFVFVLLLFGQNLTVKAQNKTERVYIKMEVNGMVCTNCAFGMEKELKKVSGVKSVKVLLKEGLAYISTLEKQKPLKESLALIITNAGFTPGKIEFSHKPFIVRETPSKE
jgi:copper chaperone CopZ